MKVMLVNSPWRKGRYWGVRAGSRWPHIKGPQEKDYLPFPFYLAYSAAMLIREDFDVSLVDALAEEMPEKIFMEKVVREAPDLLVFETSTPSLAHDLAQIRRLPKSMPVVLCGPEVNIRDPKFIENYPQVRYVMQGEYETALVELALKLKASRKPSDVSGLIWRQNGSIHVNSKKGALPDLDAFPWPWRDPLPMFKYNDAPGDIPRPSVQMIASRGCPYNCGFCVWPQVMYGGRNYRARSVEDVVNEMEFLVDRFGFKSIYFDDDTFNISKPRMLAFARELKKRQTQGRVKVPWAIMARADLMDEEILTAFRETGLAAAKYGVESSSQALLDAIDKGMDFKKNDRMVRLTQSLGIKTHLTFTFGLPGETRETALRTIDYALDVSPDTIQFSITTPFPGTWYFKELDKAGLLDSTDWSKYDGNNTSVIKTSQLSPRALENIERTAYRRWRVHHWGRTRSNGHRTAQFGMFRKSLTSIREEGLRSTLVKGVDYLGWRLNHSRNGHAHNLPIHQARQLTRSVVRDGWVQTGKKVLRRIHPRRALHKRLNVIGVMDGVRAYAGPEMVQIDPTNDCNANCIGCWCHSDLLKDLKFRAPIKGQTLPTALLKKVIDELAGMGTQALYFAGGGEPFMHPKILDVVAYAKKRGLVCYINTNFTLVTPKSIQRIIDVGVDYFTLSVWAGTAKTYSATHPNKNEATFRRVKETLALLNRSKRGQHPYIKVYHVISNINYFELEEMIAFSRDTGSEALEYTVTDTMPGLTDSLLLSEDQLKEALEICGRIRARMKDGKVDGVDILNFDHFARRLGDPRAAVAEYDSAFIDTLPCYVGWTYARILADGNVNSCLKSHRFPVGNIYEQTFRDIWNGSRQKEFRKHALAPSKEKDDFFRLIGNDPKARVGCFKSCDNLGENIPFHNDMQALAPWEKNMLRSAAQLLRQRREKGRIQA